MKRVRLIEQETGIAFSPTHWRAAPCDGSGVAGETEGLDPQGDSAVGEAEAPR